MLSRTVVFVAAAALALPRSAAPFSPTSTGAAATIWKTQTTNLPINALQPRRSSSSSTIASRQYCSADSPIPLDPPENAHIPSSSTDPQSHHQLGWVSLGISWVYLSHFASLYTQLPGLFGPTGLLPASGRVPNLDNLWALNSLPQLSSPEFGMELFAAAGIVVSALQIVFGDKLRVGPVGVATYGLLWILWHDLVFAGGRFMSYQMDILLLDAAPLTLLAASGLVPRSATFGYRWLLSRLYIGAGAVKLLSCDASWRDLSAVHWHFQSQPLPNPLGAAAYLHLPESIGKGLTLAVLAGEMAAPFLFLCPSGEVRRFAFVLNVVLMVGIALFGNFGPLQALLIVVGFALLDDLPPPPGTTIDNGQMREEGQAILLAPDDETATSTDGTSSQPAVTTLPDLPSAAVTAITLALAAGAAFWAVFNVGVAECRDSLALAPLVYDLVALGAAVAALPLFIAGGRGFGNNIGTALSSLAILAGSSSVMANGLGVSLPFNDAFQALNFGAYPYGLFAVITGVGGRPVAAIEAAQSTEGPWHYVPLLYQINDPASASASLFPLCWPHFPRLDWTLWFVPLGETGWWILRLLDGIATGDPAVLGLLDEAEFHRAFPDGPPEVVRLVPTRTYELDLDGRGWSVADDPESSAALRTISRGGGLPRKKAVDSSSSSQSLWPSLPLRPLAGAGRPEYFVWGCLGATETARRITNKAGNMRRDETEEV